MADKITITVDHEEWLNSIGSATFVIDNNSNVVFWNPACEIMTGVEKTEVLNTNKHWMGFYSSERPCLADMVMDDDWEQKIHLYDNIERATSSSRGLLASNWCQTPAGNKFLIFEANALFDHDGKIVGVIETLSDATKLKQVEEKLQVYSRAIEDCSSSVVITDPQGNIEYVNPKFLNVTGYTLSEITGNHIDMVRSEKLISTPDFWDSIKNNGEWSSEILSRKKDGSTYWNRCSLSAVYNEEGKIIHLVGLEEDVTKEYELTQKLNFEASHDLLTGLKNRREFEQQTESLLNKDENNDTIHSLCFIDLDKFKVVNDTCGHNAGDELLRQVSKLFKENVRKTDTLARLGGDEFGILMEDCELKHSMRVATDLLNVIQDYQFCWDGKTFKIGASIGIVVFTNNAIPNLIELLKQADSACYMAKDLGRNRIHVYKPDDSELAKRHGETQWVTLIQNALDEDLFYLDAQEIVSFDQSKTKHYELLIRMRNKEGISIPPGSFLSSAERYSLITKIDRWVIKTACKLLSQYKSFQEQINFVSINLSGQSLANDELLDFINNQLDETGVNGHKICFEITETSTITHLEKAQNLIKNLKERGCSFAIDDFGSGFSSYGYLKSLPVDYLKIDGIFVKDIIQDPIDLALVKSINEVGHILNMKTIAEFVENDDIRNILVDIGVDYGQGYGIGRPENFEELLKHTNDISLEKISHVS